MNRTALRTLPLVAASRGGGLPIGPKFAWWKQDKAAENSAVACHFENACPALRSIHASSRRNRRRDATQQQPGRRDSCRWRDWTDLPPSLPPLHATRGSDSRHVARNCGRTSPPPTRPRTRLPTSLFRRRTQRQSATPPAPRRSRRSEHAADGRRGPLRSERIQAGGLNRLG